MCGTFMRVGATLNNDYIISSFNINKIMMKTILNIVIASTLLYVSYCL